MVARSVQYIYIIKRDKNHGNSRETECLEINKSALVRW